MAHSKNGEIPAGEFHLWLKTVRTALRDDADMVVPCGDCTACCTSSYFIHVAVNEKKTLSRIPEELQFDAIGAARGDVLLGYREDGTCPMFENNGCSIYAHRPQTCRKFDCRILIAADLCETDQRPLINKQLAKWRFFFKDDSSEKAFEAVKMAASFLQTHRTSFPRGWVPANPIQLAVMAVKIYPFFLGENEGDFDGFSDKMTIEKKNQCVNDLIKAYEQFNEE